ncbi:MAG: hypothetical protein QW292_13035 [Candidatus Parvarchaeota archaeon]
MMNEQAMKESPNGKKYRTSILLSADIYKYFQAHPEYNVSEFIRLAVMEKIQRMGRDQK